MSRLVGIVALVIAFGWSGYLVYRLTSRRLPQKAQISLQPKPVASIKAVQLDLCTLAQAELKHQHATGHYANLHELKANGDTSLPDSRWPYTYVLHLPTPDQFVITAVSLTPIESQPRVLQIDDQLQVQARTRPPQIFACEGVSSLPPAR
jgi:hypothetical protein